MGDVSLKKAGDAASRVSGRLDRDEQLGPFVRQGRIIAMPARPARRRLLASRDGRDPADSTDSSGLP